MSITVGEDEFCLTCMEWRKCNKKGKCIVCGRQIKKQKGDSDQQSYGKFQRDEFSDETDYESDSDSIS